MWGPQTATTFAPRRKRQLGRDGWFAVPVWTSVADMHFPENSTPVRQFSESVGLILQKWEKCSDRFWFSRKCRPLGMQNRPIQFGRADLSQDQG
jgi:hypothetical protein